MEPTVVYEVWRAEPDGEPTCIQDPASGRDDIGVARHFAKAYNTEETENARLEQRKIRKRFVVVKATTTREVVEES